MLFHEIHSSYYQVTATILKKAVRGKLTGRELNALIREHAFGESFLTIPEGLQGGKWRLLHQDLSTPLEAEPSTPLTNLEKAWMKAMLLDPRIRLFHPDMTGLEDIEPLFTPDTVVYYDRYTDGDPYDDPNYIRHFETILDAIQNKRNLYVHFTSRKQTNPELVITPYFLEYSEKDDRFRLVAAGMQRRWTINLSRITECKPTEKEEFMSIQDAEQDTVTFELEDRRNAMERVLLHFSHLEKETKRLDENRYRVTMKYDRQDVTEMVIRILSFGPTVKVTEPESFIQLLRKRIDDQYFVLPN